LRSEYERLVELLATDDVMPAAVTLDDGTYVAVSLRERGSALCRWKRPDLVAGCDPVDPDDAVRYSVSTDSSGSSIVYGIVSDGWSIVVEGGERAVEATSSRWPYDGLRSFAATLPGGRSTLVATDARGAVSRVQIPT
jgi:hypothetical protein